MEMRVKAGKSYGAFAMDFDFAVSGERVVLRDICAAALESPDADRLTHEVFDVSSGFIEIGKYNASLCWD